jgi:hypothetical protein
MTRHFAYKYKIDVVIEKMREYGKYLQQKFIKNKDGEYFIKAPRRFAKDMCLIFITRITKGELVLVNAPMFKPNFWYVLPQYGDNILIVNNISNQSNNNISNQSNDEKYNNFVITSDSEEENIKKTIDINNYNYDQFCMVYDYITPILYTIDPNDKNYLLVASCLRKLDDLFIEYLELLIEEIKLY